MSSAVVSTSAALGRPFVFDEEAAAGRALPLRRSQKACLFQESPPESPPCSRFKKSAINHASRDPGIATRCPFRTRDGLQRHPRHRRPDRWSAARMPYRNLRPSLLGAHHLAPGRSGRRHPSWRILRGGGCQRHSRSPVSRRSRCGTRAIAVGALRRRCTPSKNQPLDKKGVPENANQFAREMCGTSHQSEHRLEQVLRATDLLLESGGFGLIILDLGDLPPQSARRIPLTTWFRFRRAVEHKPTILLAIEQQPIAGSCSSLLLQLGLPADESAAKRRKSAAHGASHELLVENEESLEGQKKNCSLAEAPTEVHYPHHAQLLTGLHINAEICSRLQRKPAHSITFATKTAWAG